MAQKLEELSNSFERFDSCKVLQNIFFNQPDKAVMEGNRLSVYPCCHLMITDTIYRQLPASKTNRMLCMRVTAAVSHQNHARVYQD